MAQMQLQGARQQPGPVSAAEPPACRWATRAHRRGGTSGAAPAPLFAASDTGDGWGKGDGGAHTGATHGAGQFGKCRPGRSRGHQPALTRRTSNLQRGREERYVSTGEHTGRPQQCQWYHRWVHVGPQRTPGGVTVQQEQKTNEQKTPCSHCAYTRSLRGHRCWVRGGSRHGAPWGRQLHS